MKRAIIALIAVLTLVGCEGFPANEVDPEHRDEDRGGDY